MITILRQYWPPIIALTAFLTFGTGAILLRDSNRILFLLAITITILSFLWFSRMVALGLHAFADKSRTLKVLRDHDPTAQQEVNQLNRDRNRLKVKGNNEIYQLGSHQQCTIIAPDYDRALKTFENLTSDEQVTGGVFNYKNISHRNMMRPSGSFQKKKKRPKKTAKTHRK